MDPVGGERLQRSIRCLAPEGRLLVVGFTSGTIPEVKVNRLLLRNVELVGVAWGEFVHQRYPEVEPRARRRHSDQLVDGRRDRPADGRHVYSLWTRWSTALTDLEERRATRQARRCSVR